MAAIFKGVYCYLEYYDIDNAASRYIEFANCHAWEPDNSWSYQPGLADPVIIERVLPRSRDEEYHAELIDLDIARTGNGEVTVGYGTYQTTTETVDFDDLIRYSWEGSSANVWTFDWDSATQHVTNWRQVAGGIITDLQATSDIAYKVSIAPGSVDLDVSPGSSTPYDEDVYSSPSNPDLDGQIKTRTFGALNSVMLTRITDDTDTTPKWTWNGGYNTQTAPGGGYEAVNGVPATACGTAYGRTYTFTRSATDGSTLSTASPGMYEEHYVDVMFTWEGGWIALIGGDDLGGASNPTLRETIIKFLLETDGPLSASDWSESSMTGACRNDPIGFQMSNGETIHELLSYMLEPYVTYFPNASGVWTFFDWPADVSAETSVYDIAEANIVGNNVLIRRDALEPAYKVAFEYNRRWGSTYDGSVGIKKLNKRKRRWRRRVRNWDRRYGRRLRKWMKDNPDANLPPYIQYPGFPVPDPRGQDPWHGDWPTPRDVGMKRDRPQEPDWLEVAEKYLVERPTSSYQIATDATVQTKYPNAVRETYESYMVDDGTGDVSTTATNILNWRKVQRYLWEIPVRPSTFEDGYLNLELGDVFTLTYPRWGAEDGKKLVCAGIELHAGSDYAVVTGWE